MRSQIEALFRGAVGEQQLSDEGEKRYYGLMLLAGLNGGFLPSEDQRLEHRALEARATPKQTNQGHTWAERGRERTDHELRVKAKVPCPYCLAYLTSFVCCEATKSLMLHP